jgi:CheY-like chemotaxis protein
MAVAACVVIVDPNVGTLHLLQTMIVRLNVSVIALTDPNRTFETALQIQPALIAMCDTLPYISGGELCRALRDHYHTQRIPIVLYGSSLRLHDPSYCRYTGANAVLIQPFVRGDVQRVLHQVCGV